MLVKSILSSEDYETVRIQNILKNTSAQQPLDAALLKQIIKTIEIGQNKTVRFTLRNGQILER